MIEKILHPRNLTKAYYKVVGNKGSAGIDGMTVYELASFRDANRVKLTTDVLNMKYICLLYTSPSPRDKRQYRMPSSA